LGAYADLLWILLVKNESGFRFFFRKQNPSQNGISTQKSPDNAAINYGSAGAAVI
jgi:hypothetical protein